MKVNKRDISEVIKRQRDFYNRKYSEWLQLESVNLFWRHMGDKIIQALNITEDKRYLYLGVGDGFLMEYLAGKTNAQIFGIDVSDFSIFTCNKKRGKTCFYLIADAQNLPFKDNSFDGVIAPAILHHLPQLEMAFSEFKRVLSGDKVIFSIDPRDYFLRRCFNFFIKRIVSEDEIQFKKNELEEIFRTFGFKIKSNQPMYLFMPIIVPLFRRIKIDIPRWLFNIFVRIDTYSAKKRMLQPLSWIISIVATL
jgi:ubiquinone/menaquinone biosynthesis C-methylase UbiE